MKVLSLLGSPHANGNTATALGFVEDELKEAGHDVERVNLIEKNISHCLACYHCQGNPDEPTCVQDDDAIALYGKLIGADVIIYATPLYMWTLASPLLKFMERCITLVTGYGSDAHKSLIEGKKTALVVTCGGPIEGNCDLLPQVFQRAARFTKTVQPGEMLIPFCTSPDQMAEDVKGKARELANRLME
jgi:multimeric flavodoxin WrbA